MSLQIVRFTAAQDRTEAAALRRDMWALTASAPEPMAVLGDYRMLV